MSFEINTNLNSISSFNKIFQQNLDMANQNLDTASGFEDIFNNIQNEGKAPKLKGSVESFSVQAPVGADAISAQRVENLSPTAQMAQDFGQGFKSGLEGLNAQQKNAEAALETFATGGDISVHEVMIASQKSSLSMQMALQLRNQMINAYTQLRDIRL